MFRKFILALVAIGAIAPVALAGSADAKPKFNGPKNINGPKFYPKPYPHPHPFPKPFKPNWHPVYPKPHHPPLIVVERPVVQQVVRPVVRNIVAPAPKPVSCLTKEYTPEGMLIFKDVCTNETASTPIPGTPAAAAAAAQQMQQIQPAPQTDGKSSAAPMPNNVAGQSYEDVMAAQRNAQANAPADTQPTAKN